MTEENLERFNEFLQAWYFHNIVWCHRQSVLSPDFSTEIKTDVAYSCSGGQPPVYVQPRGKPEDITPRQEAICNAVYSFVDQHIDTLDKYLKDLWDEQIPTQNKAVDRLVAQLGEKEIRNHFLVSMYDLQPDLIETIGLEKSTGLAAIRCWHICLWNRLQE